MKTVTLNLERTESLRNECSQKERAINYVKKDLENHAVVKPPINTNTRTNSLVQTQKETNQTSKKIGGKFHSHSAEFVKNFQSFKNAGYNITTLSINQDLMKDILTSGKSTVKVVPFYIFRDGKHLT